MTRKEALEKTLLMFKRYYNIYTENVPAPFTACAEFAAHEEGYFLMKIAKVCENDSAEYVYFWDGDTLTEDIFHELDEKAWEMGLAKANVCYGHKSTDVTLVILADQIEDGVEKLIKKHRRFKSYRCGFHGYSHFNMVALDLSTDTITTNRQGDHLKKLLSNIKK